MLSALGAVGGGWISCGWPTCLVMVYMAGLRMCMRHVIGGVEDFFCFEHGWEIHDRGQHKRALHFPDQISTARGETISTFSATISFVCVRRGRRV